MKQKLLQLSSIVSHAMSAVPSLGRVRKGLLLLALVALPMLAQAEEHDNRLYLGVGDSEDLSQVTLSLYLDNPTIALTAVEVYVTLPEGATLSAGSRTSRATQHTLTEGATAEGHFVSLASPALATFAGDDGALCSWTVDLSQLPMGQHTITASGLFAVGVDADGATDYTVADQQLTVTLTPTGIAAPTVQGGTLTVYTLQGQRLTAPQRGQVNIVNGKKRLIQK